MSLPISSSGGLIHLGNIPLFIGAFIFGRRTGALAGSFGMALFDLTSFWTIWAPFTFVIVGLMGYVMGKILPLILPMQRIKSKFYADRHY